MRWNEKGEYGGKKKKWGSKDREGEGRLGGGEKGGKEKKLESK